MSASGKKPRDQLKELRIGEYSGRGNKELAMVRPEAEAE
jgi:hypothetical protein